MASDVYKRQPDDRFYDVMRELSSIGNNINQLAAKANTPVSYTHLDVYKRQGHRRASLPNT